MTRLLALTAAALLTTAIATAPAAARPGVNHGHGWHNGHRRVCRVVWRHHRRVRVCHWR